MLKFWTNFEKKIFYFKIKNIKFFDIFEKIFFIQNKKILKFWTNFEKIFFIFKMKNIKILDEF